MLCSCVAQKLKVEPVYLRLNFWSKDFSGAEAKPQFIPAYTYIIWDVIWEDWGEVGGMVGRWVGNADVLGRNLESPAAHRPCPFNPLASWRHCLRQHFSFNHCQESLRKNITRWHKTVKTYWGCYAYRRKRGLSRWALASHLMSSLLSSV